GPRSALPARLALVLGPRPRGRRPDHDPDCPPRGVRLARRCVEPPARGHPHVPRDVALRSLAGGDPARVVTSRTVAGLDSPHRPELAMLADHLADRAGRRPRSGRLALGGLPGRLSDDPGCLSHRGVAACPGRDPVPAADDLSRRGVFLESVWFYLVVG